MAKIGDGGRAPRRPAARGGAQRPGATRAAAARSRPPVAAPRETAPREPSAPELWFRNLRVSGFTVVILVLVVLTVVVLAPSLRILVEQRQQIAALEAGLKADKESVQELQKDVARWQDPAYIEAQARERLYYIFPGEYSYLVIDDTGAQTTTDGAPISTELQTTKVDWVKGLLSSVFTAGLTDATPDQLPSPTVGG
ncbi:MAG: septum formation initiator family protein [Rhodoglobus sp.]